MSEGGYQAKDGERYAGPGLNMTLKTVATAPVVTPIVSIKINQERPSAIVIPTEVNMLVQTSDVVSYYLYLNAGLTGAAFSAYANNSNTLVDTTASGMSGGTIIKQGFLSSSAQVKDKVNLNDPDIFNYQLGMSINRTSDTITLAASSYGNTADVFAVLGWTELN